MVQCCSLARFPSAEDQVVVEQLVMVISLMLSKICLIIIYHFFSKLMLIFSIEFYGRRSISIISFVAFISSGKYISYHLEGEWIRYGK